jgi:hypothetical protein
MRPVRKVVRPSCPSGTPRRHSERVSSFRRLHRSAAESRPKRSVQAEGGAVERASLPRERARPSARPSAFPLVGHHPPDADCVNTHAGSAAASLIVFEEPTGIRSRPASITNASLPASRLYDLPLAERLRAWPRPLARQRARSALAGEAGLSQHKPTMIENAIGVFGLPLGAVNFRSTVAILVLMAIEEPSVVAGASFMARLAR